MVTIYKRLSQKVQKGTNLAEVLISLKNGKDYFVRGKSGIFVTPSNFRKGEIFVNRRKLNNDNDYHEEQLRKMQNLEAFILKSLSQTINEEINGEWLKSIIFQFHNPNTIIKGKKKSLEDLITEFLDNKNFSAAYKPGVLVAFRDIKRYELYKRATKNPKYKFDPYTVKRAEIEEFISYIRNEHKLYLENTALLEKIIQDSQGIVPKGNNIIKPKGENTIIGIVKKIKSFFLWLNNTERIDNNPFKSISLGSTHYGTPYYLSIDERNKIAQYPFTSAYLARQRDIFIFQCLVGCRVSDLERLTKSNVSEGFLVYAPHKTKDDGEQTLIARVPLHEQAKAIIERYKNTAGDKLLPCIPSQKYNNAIKEILSIVGIDRIVTVRNPLTGEPEQRHINEIASSHMARRTFVGNAYSLVKDPNIVGKMSGHVEGSKAFARYRNIDDSILKDVISNL